MKMKYPIIEDNAICDGLMHEIIPSRLQSFIYNGILLYFFDYYDLNYQTQASTFLMTDRAGNYHKVPLRNYPDKSFFEHVVLREIPLPPENYVIPTDRVYESIDDYCYTQIHMTELKKPQNNTSIAVAQTLLPPDPQLETGIKPEQKRRPFYGFELENYSSRSSVLPCIALGFPNKNTINFYDVDSIADIHANFDGFPSYDYLIGRLKTPIKTINCGTNTEYISICSQIKDGQFNVNMGETVNIESTKDSFKGNEITRKNEVKSSLTYEPIYFVDNFSKDYLFWNVRIRDNESTFEYDFISNKYWNIKEQHYNYLVDEDYQIHVLSQGILNSSNTFHFEEEGMRK